MLFNTLLGMNNQYTPIIAITTALFSIFLVEMTSEVNLVWRLEVLSHWSFLQNDWNFPSYLSY